MVVLSVLKWIGIVLGWLVLGLLALVLLILLLVLFVPVRYRVGLRTGEEERFSYGIHVTWILHAISVRKKLDEDSIVIRILGIPVSRMGGSAPAGEKAASGEPPDEEEEILPEPAAETKPDPPDEEEEILPEPAAETKPEPAVEETTDTGPEEEEPERIPLISESEETPKKGPISRIREKIDRMKSKIRERIKKFGFLFFRLSSIMDLVKDSSVRNTVKKLLKETVRMVRYVGPKKITGTLEFGTGDPASTGLILGGVSLMRTAHRKGVSITPNFEEKCLVGNCELRGRIRGVYFVRMAIRIWFDKEVRRLWKRYRRMNKQVKKRQKELSL
ncbi:MAG: DUF2953 domain-containing protein [Eubacterium sp.]|nr:DUF2953 domain-containing protein [Eubacterium sp.]